jgi:isopenicillin-N N-acyltransferase-like protein
MFEKTDLAREQDVLSLAEQHVPVLASFDAGLSDELHGIAAASGLTPAHIVVLNHYTDLRDLGHAHLDDNGCSVMYAPAADGSGPLLGQTWDTHGSATDFVRLLDVRDGRGRTLLFTITGCLGMAGLNDRGVGLMINNLNSVDAQVGVVWPALVRRALSQDTARAARDEVLAAPIGSGHHYMVADAREVFGVETSGTKKKVIQEGAERVHLHTNHCLDEEMMATAEVSPTSTTRVRYQTLADAVAAGATPTTAAGMLELFGGVSAQRKLEDGNAVATCGVFIADLATPSALTAAGPAGAGVDSSVLDLSK